MWPKRRCKTTIDMTIRIILRVVFKSSISNGYSYLTRSYLLAHICSIISTRSHPPVCHQYLQQMVDSPRKAYLKTLVRRPRIPKCPNGNIHCEDICMGASRGENIGRYYYYVSNILDATAVFIYISSSAKHGLEKTLAFALQFIISRCTLNSDRTNLGTSLRISTSG